MPRDQTAQDGLIESALYAVSLIPSEYRNFEVDLTSARTLHGFEPPLLERLVRRGLPVAETSARFDALDLANVALWLGLRSVQRLALRSWAATLKTISSAGTAFQVEYKLPNTSRDRGPLRNLTVWTQRNAPRMIAARDGDTLAMVTFPITRSWPPCPAGLGEVLKDVAKLQFMLLPGKLKVNTAFTRSTGLADCDVGASLILEECEVLGLPARRVSGLLLCSPFSVQHSWTEVQIGGVWTSFDPLIIMALQRYAGLPESAWPVTKPVGTFMASLSDDKQAIVQEDGTAVQVNFLTHLLN